MPVLLVINVLVFVAMVVTGVSPISPDTAALLRWGGTYDPSITRGEWWRLLTAMFVHAGFMHLLFNMLALYNIGALVERMFGRVPFLVLYVLSGVGGSIASAYWHPLSVGVGASGAIFGLYGGLGGFLLRAGKSLPSDIVAPLRNSAVAFVLFNGVYGVMQPNIDVVAHVGGLASGFVAAIALATAAQPSGASARRALAVFVAAGTVLALVGTRLPAFGDWSGSLRTLSELESHSAEVTSAAMQKVTDRQIDAAAFARLLEEQVIAPWQQHRNRMSAMQLPANERRLAAKAVEYMDHRTGAWQLLADAFRTEDMALMAKSNAEQAAANEAAQELLRSLGVKVTETKRAPSAAAVRADAGERDLAQAVEALRQLESKSVQLYNDGIQRVRSGRLSSSAFADVIQTQIAKPWDRELEVVAALRTSGPVEGSRKRIEQYMRLRGEGWHLSARAFRAESAVLARQASELFAKAAALASTATPADTSQRGVTPR
jgi:rhomboid protease GluP